jgi:hypothetical protein
MSRMPFMWPLLAVAVSGAAASPQRANQPVGPPAGITAEIRPSGDLEVTIQNNRAVAIEAWSVQVTWRGSSARDSTDEMTTDTYPTLIFPAVGDGPIAPGERRVIDLGPHPRAVIKSTGLLLALYADLSYEGQPVTRDEVLRQRERDAVDLGGWLSVLSEARTKPAEEMSPILKKALEARTATPGTPPTALGRSLDESVARVLRATSGTPSALPAGVAQLMSVFERLRELALRHTRRPPAG